MAQPSHSISIYPQSYPQKQQVYSQFVNNCGKKSGGDLTLVKKSAIFKMNHGDGEGETSENTCLDCG
ncbi:hypothetical protein CV945_02230 [Geobacillus sp. Manikaran-105]|nr:hypothetical protein CV945_02230 [Geobacillus sp. Manikaran-105]